jgi:hypothetical protein
MPLETVNYLKEEGRIDQDYEGTGIKRNGKEWRQFHVDCCKAFWDYLHKTSLEDQYREELVPDDPCYIPLGHDEAAVNHHDFSKFNWRGAKGQQAIMPKRKRKDLHDVRSRLKSIPFGSKGNS